ncbi:nitrous oxide reductase accessory protein NosL [Bacillus aquiflavi]|uniref:Nitrous oxide reductase accessory protein NosL n=1 Tax=Bacillus aquiflavi TaxID=2672567 RepID=A0A6B3VSZ4_9BACI|nr:nitrous oxide reductase accessory protein NosL [Bacillus aquiflavi]MBA4536732.1 nitrous oxide reductase accessory protein NosL [Bacillus aquiflavi]NEY81099.1 hypothetical protein [Bacillus aquiflavi]
MKKMQMLLLVVIAALFISACGKSDNTSEKKEDQSPKTEETAATEVKDKDDESSDEADATPKEPTESDKCAFCNMEVYGSDHEMGVFTVQAINKDGEHLFFDDSGCLLNMERQLEEHFNTKWVRDHETKEWIDADSAVIVKGEFETPMKYGYAFFKDEESANKFIEENSDKNAALSSWDEIDKVSNERYMKKMQNQNGEAHGHDETDEDAKDEHGGH